MKTKQFKAESVRLLDLMINSIYTNREIFLRELISNASDAIDKIYYKALTDDNVTFDKDKYFIRLKADKDARTLTVSDTGIGMTYEELEENLGTIAKSGSHDLKTTIEEAEEHDIIGQFGVGFYASFMVAKKVIVESKAYGSDQAYRWSSEGSSGFTIEPCDKKEVGTDIILFLKDNSEDENFDEFLEPYRLQALVTHYSNYIGYPIKMEMEKSRAKEGTEKEPEFETYTEDTILNSMVPLWRKNKNELNEEDYHNFYQEKHFGFDTPLLYTHLSVEGLMSYRAILFVPSQPSYDFYSKDYEKGLALYANGVLIMEKCEELLPDYFAFVKGVVDSEDLSLNISRETIQHNRQLRMIGNRIEQKISEELQNLLKNDREKYETFYKAFGRQLKFSVYNDYGMHKDKLQDFLLFHSAKNEKLISFKEYIETMQEDQENIYYATGDTIDFIDQLPQVSIVKNKGYDILYLTEEVDEFVFKVIGEYEGKSFKSVSDEASDETEEKVSEEDQKLLDAMKDHLGDAVVKVKTTKQLKDDLVYLSTVGDISIDMEKTLNAMPIPQDIKANKVLEINANHRVFNKLKEAYTEEDQSDFKLYTEVLYNQARIISGLPIEDPLKFTANLTKLMEK
jgi:molecular chaperone HtpG